MSETEKTVACIRCQHPVWFTASDGDETRCTDCGTNNSRSQPNILSDSLEPLDDLSLDTIVSALWMWQRANPKAVDLAELIIDELHDLQDQLLILAASRRERSAA